MNMTELLSPTLGNDIGALPTELLIQLIKLSNYLIYIINPVWVVVYTYACRVSIQQTVFKNKKMLRLEPRPHDCCRL